MASDRLTLGQGLDPGGCQRGRLDAETGIDHDKALGEQLGKMHRLTGRARKPDARRLSDVIHAKKNQIEPPRANAARLQKGGELPAEFFDDALQILRITDGLCEFQFNARHIDRNQRRLGFIGAAKSLIEPQQNIRPETQAQAGARLGGKLRHPFDPDILQRGYGLL